MARELTVIEGLPDGAVGIARLPPQDAAIKIERVPEDSS